MNPQWNKIASTQPGVDRYKATHRRAEAWIERKADQSAEAGSKSGLFGLGTHVEAYFTAPAPSDEVILERLEKPRFDQWEKLDKQSPGTTYYQGEADNFFGSKVKAAITRVGDEAKVEAKVGLFGTHIEGHYFAPAPTDREILQKISRRHD